ncbi:MAG: hypothetical protein JJ900_12415 [Rhodospirillales bacterium]|nr:hypothetical protein [Rhodospirillales bacterium]MBO6787648.1 hypothetical protein [Rhodospirillales bacterium]
MLSVENQLAWMPTTIGTGTANQKPPQELALRPLPEDAPAKEFTFFGDDGLSFWDVVDVINPLQHIPFVSTLYREMTGDTIAPAPRVAGSTLFFGPLGLAGALANVFVEGSTGKDIGEHMAGWVNPEAETETAAATATLETTADPAALDPHDPVLSWARGEADWMRRNAGTRPAPAAGTDAPNDNDIPDAAPFLREETPAPTQPIGIAEMAYLTNDARAAARAYAVAANLAPAN